MAAAPVSHQYRLYPVVDQVADKVCATMTEYDERTSTREKDLVDLVVIATTQDIDGTALRVATVTEARRRQMEPFDSFTVPSAWGAGYARLSRPVPTAPITGPWPSPPISRSASLTPRSPAMPMARRGRTRRCPGPEARRQSASPP